MNSAFLVGGITYHKAYFPSVSLPASFIVWLSSPEARFLKSKFLWSNWDVDELKSQAKEIESSGIFRVGLGGWPFDSVGTAGDFLART